MNSTMQFAMVISSPQHAVLHGNQTLDLLHQNRRIDTLSGWADTLGGISCSRDRWVGALRGHSGAGHCSSKNKGAGGVSQRYNLYDNPEINRPAGQGVESLIRTGRG